jgi:hypothetical protein
VFGRKLIVMLGEDDTNPHHKHLPRSPQANAQGRHRFERGQNFYQTAKKQAAELHASFHWELVTVPGVAHSDSKMAAAALRYLLGESAAAEVPQKEEAAEQE